MSNLKGSINFVEGSEDKDVIFTKKKHIDASGTTALVSYGSIGDGGIDSQNLILKRDEHIPASAETFPSIRIVPAELCGCKLGKAIKKYKVDNKLTKDSDIEGVPIRVMQISAGTAISSFHLRVKDKCKGFMFKLAIAPNVDDKVREIDVTGLVDITKEFDLTSVTREILVNHKVGDSSTAPLNLMLSEDPMADITLDEKWDGAFNLMMVITSIPADCKTMPCIDLTVHVVDKGFDTSRSFGSFIE